MQRDITLTGVYDAPLPSGTPKWDVVPSDGERLQTFSSTMAEELRKHVGSTITVEYDEQQSRKQKDDGSYWINRTVTGILGEDVPSASPAQAQTNGASTAPQAQSGESVSERKESIEFQNARSTAFAYGAAVGYSPMECFALLEDMQAHRRGDFKVEPAHRRRDYENYEEES